MAVVCCGYVAFTTSAVPHAICGCCGLSTDSGARRGLFAHYWSDQRRGALSADHHVRTHRPRAVTALIDAHNRGVDTKVILDAAFPTATGPTKRPFKNSAMPLFEVKMGPQRRYLPSENDHHRRHHRSRQHRQPDAQILLDQPRRLGVGHQSADVQLSPRPSKPTTHYTFRTRASAHLSACPHLVSGSPRGLSAAYRSGHEEHRRHQRGTQGSCRAVCLDKVARRGFSAELFSPKARPGSMLWPRCRLLAAPCTSSQTPKRRCTCTRNPAHRQHHAHHRQPNLSTTSLLENRELSLALDTATAPDLIAAVESTFDADYAAASASRLQPHAMIDTDLETLVSRLFRDGVQFCRAWFDLVVCVGRHRGGSHRFALVASDS